MADEYTLLDLLKKLYEMQDEHGRISMDQLAQLALDSKLPQDKFDSLIKHLIAHRNDYERRKQLMNQLPSITDEMNDLIARIQKGDESVIDMFAELQEFQEKFESLSNEISEINDRISEKQKPS